MSGDSTTVLIVDDHDVLAESLALALEAEPDLTVVGRAGTLAEARRLLPRTRPDVLLLDVRLPDGDGVAAIPELLDAVPGVKVVVLTASTADHVLISAIEAGACGYLSKTDGLSAVVGAVQAAANDEAVISSEMLARLLPRMRRGASAGATTLTEREREVLQLVARGLQNTAIADELHVSVHTVRNHIANLSAKLGAHSKLEALSLAIRTGLIAG